MRNGEGGGLSSERAHRTASTKTWEKHFRFQTARDDAREHFLRLSMRHRSCWFVLGYSDPDGDEAGGHLIWRGECRSFRMSRRSREGFYRRVGYAHDSDTEENEFREEHYRRIAYANERFETE